MKLLVLDEEFPFPLNSGKRIRSYNLTLRLARKHHLSYMAYGSVDSESFRQFQKDNLHPIPVRESITKKEGIKFYLQLAANLFSPDPYIVTSHYSNAFAQKLPHAIKNDRPDVIICEWTPYAQFVKGITDIPTVVVAHNIETTIWRRYFENEKNLAKRWYIGRQADKVARFESGTFSSVAGATAVTEGEAEEIRALCSSLPVEVVANGVDLDFFCRQPDQAQKRRIVFTGAMDWRPNQDAVVFFVERIFPLIRAQDSNIESFIVGRRPPDSIRQFNDLDGITVTGTVDDVRPYISGAAVYIVPLRIGGGSRLKILEALAMEKAVVSTSVGAEGLNVVDGRELIIADNPELFCKSIFDLLDDEGSRGSLGKAGRQLVVEQYGWDALATRLDTFLETIREKQ
ncbi:MAG: glycosyltransferase [candidate division Zixibacteria bacterium]